MVPQVKDAGKSDRGVPRLIPVAVLVLAGSQKEHRFLLRLPMADSRNVLGVAARAAAHLADYQLCGRMSFKLAAHCEAGIGVDKRVLRVPLRPRFFGARLDYQAGALRQALDGDGLDGSRIRRHQRRKHHEQNRRAEFAAGVD